jgi:peptide chain release factor 1
MFQNLTIWQSVEELKSLLRDPTSDAELKEFANEDLEQSIQQRNDASRWLTASLVPKHPFAELPCLIEIRPGVGGSEAALFTADLLRMYQGYCAQNNLRTSIISLEHGGTGSDQLIEAILEVESAGAYSILRCEAGVHRVQRVPETEAQGRVHTSTASVMVLPSFPKTNEDSAIDFNDPTSDFYIDPKDTKREFMRASGAGGQHVNKTESAIRITHIPTNTVVACQDSRSRFDNEKTAWALLRSRIAQARREAREEEVVKLRRSIIGVARVGRADKIRTYNWQQQRVTDHRSGMTVHGIDGIMAGGENLEKLMDGVRKWLIEGEVEDLRLTVTAKENPPKKGKS